MHDDNIIYLKKILYPEEYNTNYIFTYPAFNNELKDLIEKSGYVKEFKTKYHKSLRFLEQLKQNCIMQPKLFEHLLDADGIYSIMLKGKKNLRILFDFQEFQGENLQFYTIVFKKNEQKIIQKKLKQLKSEGKKYLEIR